MQEPSSRKRVAVALVSALVAGILAGPVRASDTEDDLKKAKAQLSEVQGEARAATAEYEAANGRYIQTQDEVAETRQRLKKVERRMERLVARLGERAREAYQMGGAGMLDLLFVSDSLSDFSDRVVFLDRIAQEDADLVLRADVLSEQLDRYRADLAALLEEQEATLEVLEKKRSVIHEKLAEAEALKEKLQSKLERELAAARAAAAAARSAGSTTVVTGGALKACPAPGTGYVDSWGAPRSGGRSHKGVDMMGPAGTPVYAAQAGQMTQSSSSLGGRQAYVNSGNGDTTFYAHLQSWTGGPRSVSAGEQIGTIGDSGNAQGNPHLHFEYHPGGGGAVNPYPYVKAVCG